MEPLPLSMQVGYPGRFHFRYVLGTLTLNQTQLALTSKKGDVQFHYAIDAIAEAIYDGTFKFTIVTKDAKKHVLLIGTTTSPSYAASTGIDKLDQLKKLDADARQILQPWLTFFDKRQLLKGAKNSRVSQEIIDGIGTAANLLG